MRKAKMMSKWLTALLLGLSLSVAHAEAPVSWDELGMSEQQLLKPYAERWDSLSPAQRQRLQQGARRWQAMDGGQRAETRERFNRWRQLSPMQKQHIRERYRQFRQLPPGQQARLRERMEQYQALPPEEREQLRRRWEGMSSSERAAVAQRLNKQGAEAEREEKESPRHTERLREPHRERRTMDRQPMRLR
jgi:hypothetical protein